MLSRDNKEEREREREKEREWLYGSGEIGQTIGDISLFFLARESCPRLQSSEARVSGIL